ncbi:ribonuclease P protein component [candidate division KSB1 bacterium]|nr:ribonuclease P protein component [candidate division KSB1 bacterium]
MKKTLKRNEILKKNELFHFAFKNGSHFSGKFIKVTVAKYDKKLVGFTVTKRCRGAVKRNRLKRLMRELYRHHKELFGQGIIIFHAKVYENFNYQMISEDLNQIINQMSSLGSNFIHKIN